MSFRQASSTRKIVLARDGRVGRSEGAPPVLATQARDLIVLVAMAGDLEVLVAMAGDLGSVGTCDKNIFIRIMNCQKSDSAGNMS